MNSLKIKNKNFICSLSVLGNIDFAVEGKEKKNEKRKIRDTWSPFFLSISIFPSTNAISLFLSLRDNEASDLELIRSKKEKQRNKGKSWSDSWNLGDEVLYINKGNKESYNIERRRKRNNEEYYADDGFNSNCRHRLRSPDFTPNGASGSAGSWDRVTVCLRECRDFGARICYFLLIIG